jgi:hypothetical protein
VPDSDERGAKLLRDRTGNLRKDVIGIRADQPDCTYHDDQNDSQHHRILSDILAMFFAP